MPAIVQLADSSDNGDLEVGSRSALGLRSWLWSKMGMPAYRAERIRREKAWDYAQANDWAILEADPAKDEVLEAAALLDPEPERAFSSLLALAQRGSVWSMVNVAWCYEVGRGTPVSARDAEDWYQLAYEAGCDRALIAYGGMLGARGAVDLQQQVYAAGAARDWAPAMYRLASFELRYARTREDHLKCKSMLERAAGMGSPGARMLLASYLLSGRFGRRSVAAGIRVAFAILKDRFAEIDREAEDRKAEESRPPPGVTLH